MLKWQVQRTLFFKISDINKTWHGYTSSGYGQRPVLRYCELCNELSGSVWGETFLSSAEWLLAA